MCMWLNPVTLFSSTDWLPCSVCSDRYADPSLCLGVTAAPGVEREAQQGVFHQDGHGSQDEGGEQVHVDVVPHAVELPGAEVTV